MTANKPSERQKPSIVPTKREPAAVVTEYSSEWDEGWRPATYLYIPNSMFKFSKYDPRKNKWRRKLS